MTTCDQGTFCDQLWPGVTSSCKGPTKGKGTNNATRYVFVSICDQLWPAVAKCDQLHYEGAKRPIVWLRAEWAKLQDRVPQGQAQPSTVQQLVRHICGCNVYMASYTKTLVKAPRFYPVLVETPDTQNMHSWEEFLESNFILAQDIMKCFLKGIPLGVETWLTGCQTQSERGNVVNIVTILHNYHKKSQMLIIVTIGHNCHNCSWFSKLSHLLQLSFHNCHLSELVSFQNWSKFLPFITIVTVISNCLQLYSYNYCLSQLVAFVKTF